jgi:hypothetical protein
MGGPVAIWSSSRCGSDVVDKGAIANLETRMVLAPIRRTPWQMENAEAHSKNRLTNKRTRGRATTGTPLDTPLLPHDWGAEVVHRSRFSLSGLEHIFDNGYMSSAATDTIDPLAAWSDAVDALAKLPADVTGLRALDESTLLKLNELQAQASRYLGAAGAAIAGEVAYRSRPALGMSGLAQRAGFRTPERMLTQTTGATKQQVLTALNAGKLLVEIADDGAVDEVTGEVLAPTQPWLRPVASAVSAGQLSTSAAQAIGTGLGSPNSAVTALQLETAAARLVDESIAGMDADRLWKRARDARDELDVAGVKVREAELFETRDITHFPLPDGRGKAIWTMDPETYTEFKDFYDRSTSPKLGAVRFVSKEQSERAATIADDERTPGQLASDSLIQLMKLGADHNPNFLLGSGAPVIRITVPEQALETGVGFGTIEGQGARVSMDTVQRLMCGGDSIRMGFDPRGNVLDIEREQRLYSRRQREVLAVKFGGCMDPNCDRPPSWCESHHIAQWVRDGGKTVIENGILLCKWHHLKYHNEGYEIECDDGGDYWRIPPASVDPEQKPVPMPLKSTAIADLWRQRRAG